jgi:hypothetical protein
MVLDNAETARKIITAAFDLLLDAIKVKSEIGSEPVPYKALNAGH